MRKNETSNGKKGGLLKGKPHYDENGKPLGGIKAIVTDTKTPVELEGGEVIINKHASRKFWKELSKINQSAGNGVPINNPNGGDDEDPEEYRDGGRIIDFNPNHLPNKRILTYAKKIKSEYPKVWDLGGNIFGNEAFKNLQRVSERGYWLDSEKWMYIKWRSFVARHTHDFRIKGVIAMLKWVDKVDKGWDYMKNLIEAEIEKKYPSKMEKGGQIITYKNKFNKKYGFGVDERHSLKDIAKITGLKLSSLQDIYDKGIGAYKTNPESVRPNVKSKEQWAMARVYSAIMGGKAAKVDANELTEGKMEKGGSTATHEFTCEIIKNGERQIDAKSVAKLTKCINSLPQTKELNSVNGKYTDERVKLHNKIIKEAKRGVTCITKGKPIAVLMGGSPASGKTTFLKKYRPYLLQNNLFKVDADEVRAQLPEYKGWNASQTHKETGDIVKALISDRNIGVPCLFDFIYDGTMTGVEKYESLINFLEREGYEIFIVFMGNVSIDVVKERALKRYQKSGRFVPMEVLDDFFRTGENTLNQLKSKVDGYIVVDASSPNYEIIERGGKELPNKRIYDKLGETIKLAKGGGVKSNNKLGDCYKAAGNIVMDYRGNNNNEIKFIGTPRLVHAEVSGQGEIEGIRYGHAFVIDDAFVYDYSNNRKIELPKSIYYRVGKINQKKPLYFEYTFEEAMKKMRETMNYGPWELKTKSGL